MKTVGVIGYGRFGELLAGLLKSDFEVTVIEPDKGRLQAAQGAGFDIAELSDIGKLDVIVLAVPISSIADTINEISPYVTEDQLMMDICSVKVYPANLMKKHLAKCQLIATHPMFGPESASNGLKGLQVAICPMTANDDNVQMVVGFWQKLGVQTIVTTPEDHDKNAAYSQAFSYSIARILLGVDLSDVNLRTRSFDLLSEVAQLSANDSEQLFHDMLYYNPYYKEMKAKLLTSVDSTRTKLEEIEREQDTTKIF